MSCTERVSKRALLGLLEEQRYRCALTGRELTPQDAQVDHIAPISRGGSQTMENVWILHHQVNAAKGTMTAEEFIALCEEVVRHHRRHQRQATGPTLSVGLSIEIKPLPLFG